MNRVELTGRLTKDPVINYSQNGGTVTSFTLAVDRSVKKGDEWVREADFIRCVAFGKKAEFVEKYFNKGSFAVVSGSIKTGSYDKDGITVYTTDIWVENVEFGGAKNEADTERPTPAAATDIGDGFMNIPDEIDEELPFS